MYKLLKHLAALDALRDLSYADLKKKLWKDIFLR